MDEYYDFLNGPEAFSTQAGELSLALACPADLNFLPEPECDSQFRLKMDDVTGDSAESTSSAPCTPDSERILALSVPKAKSFGVTMEEPGSKRARYKSKDSERNRRNRINERMQELKELLPRFNQQKEGNGKALKKELTKEEILSEAVQHIKLLHSLLGDKMDGIFEGLEERVDVTNQNDGKSRTDGIRSKESPTKRKKPAKRARMMMAILFAVGIGLCIFPFLNPPQSHPLYGGKRIPRHHSRILAAANMTNTCLPNTPDDTPISAYSCPLKSMEDPHIEDLFKSKPNSPSFYCSVLRRRCTPHLHVILTQDFKEVPSTIPIIPCETLKERVSEGFDNFYNITSESVT